MKKLIVTIAAFLAVPGIAFAAEPPAEPKECCCEKMKQQGKDCCADKDKGAKPASDPHAGHSMEKPKS